MYDITVTLSEPVDGNEQIQTIVNHTLDTLMENLSDSWVTDNSMDLFQSLADNFTPLLSEYTFTTSDGTMRFSDFGGQMFNFEDVPVVMSEDDFSGLKTDMYNKLSNQQQQMYKECTICQESFEPTKSVTELKCSHVFCTDCIHQWLTKCKCVCPICKKDQRSESED